MSRQTFREPMADPPVANQTTVTGGTAITALWDAANLTALPGNTVKAGQAYKVTAWGIVTTAVTGADRHLHAVLRHDHGRRHVARRLHRRTA
jgi:hypothetical protein